MLRRLCVEAVGAQHFTAAQQHKPIAGHDEMQVAGLAADGAIAFRYLDAGRGQDLEPYPAAVTSTGVSNHAFQAHGISREVICSCVSDE